MYRYACINAHMYIRRHIQVFRVIILRLYLILSIRSKTKTCLITCLRHTCIIFIHERDTKAGRYRLEQNPQMSIGDESAEDGNNRHRMDHT